MLLTTSSVFPKVGNSHERAGAAAAVGSFGGKGGKYQFLRIVRMVFLFLEGLIPKLLFSPCRWLCPSQDKLPWSESKASPGQESCRVPRHPPGFLCPQPGLCWPGSAACVRTRSPGRFYPCPSRIRGIMGNFTVWERFQGNKAELQLQLLWSWGFQCGFGEKGE